VTPDLKEQPMKKLGLKIVSAFILVAALGARASAAERPRYDITAALGPVAVSSQTTGMAGVSLAAPTSGRNCLTSLVVTSTNAFSPSILDGSTPILTSGTTAAAGNFIKEWPVGDPLCASVGNALVIRSTGTATGGGRMDFSYQGFVGN
jgi:hypothetical protein